MGLLILFLSIDAAVRVLLACLCDSEKGLYFLHSTMEGIFCLRYQYSIKYLCVKHTPVCAIPNGPGFIPKNRTLLVELT